MGSSNRTAQNQRRLLPSLHSAPPIRMAVFYSHGCAPRRTPAPAKSRAVTEFRRHPATAITANRPTGSVRAAKALSASIRSNRRHPAFSQRPRYRARRSHRRRPARREAKRGHLRANASTAYRARHGGWLRATCYGRRLPTHLRYRRSRHYRCRYGYAILSARLKLAKADLVRNHHRVRSRRFPHHARYLRRLRHHARAPPAWPRA